jgi:hypothetical protein
VSEKRALRKIFGPKREEVTGVGEHFIRRKLIIFTLQKILLG